MKCNQICEWNGWGQDVSCFRPAKEKCPMVMTVDEFDSVYGDEAARKVDEALRDLERNWSQQAKADAGKLQIHMVPMQIVRDIAEVRMYGTKKYGDENNWRKVELMRYVDAMLRHTLAFAEDIYSVDEESGIPHYKHAECNWSFISQLMHEGKCPPKKECVADGRAGSQAADAPGE